MKVGEKVIRVDEQLRLGGDETFYLSNQCIFIYRYACLTKIKYNLTETIYNLTSFQTLYTVRATTQNYPNAKIDKSMFSNYKLLLSLYRLQPYLRRINQY